MGLNVNVFRANRDDCSLGGMSTFDTLCLVNVPGPFEPRADTPPAYLIENVNLGRGKGLLKIVPAISAGGRWQPTTGGMFGGCYAASSDSRFWEACSEIIGGYAYGAVPIHDRYEG